MRTLWNVISFLAVVNLLALTLFVGWLGSSDRLSLDRLLAMQAIFQPTQAEVNADAKLVANKVELEAEEEKRSTRRADPALPAANELNQSRLVRRMEADSQRRLGEVAGSRLAELEQRQQILANDRQAFEAEKAAWETTTAAARKTQTDVQFQKTVKLYESAPAASAKAWIQTLVDSGERTQAVAYLNAMNPMASKKIFTLFKTDEEVRLATELLERIRTLGQRQDPEDRSNVNQPAFDSSNPDFNP